jgi:hypothetical protein
MLGIEAGHTFYDEAIIMHINAAFMNLNQLGVGPVEGFQIQDSTTEWSDFLSEEKQLVLGYLKTYVFLKVKLIFDPPTSSFVLSAMDNNIKESEWRIKVQMEKPSVDIEEDDV